MTIRLSKDLEAFILSLVQAGQFSSVDEVMGEAARLLLLQQAPASKPLSSSEFDQMLLGLGLLCSIPDTAADYDDPDDQPITIQGEPLSETIIRDRR